MRRLSDAEFCSDAHRSAFNAEAQNLAMARLMTPQPSLGRTQKLPAVRSVEMPPMGDSIPFAPLVPPAANGARLAPEPIGIAPIVISARRELRSRQRTPRKGRAVRILTRPARGKAPASAVTAVFPLSHPPAVHLANRLSSPAGYWRGAPAGGLFPVAARAAAAPASAAGAPAPAMPVPVPAVQDLRHRRAPALPASNRLSSLAQSPAGGAAGPLQVFRSPVAGPGLVCRPVSRLRAIVAPKPADETDKLLPWLAGSPLAALLAATGYTTVSPSAPAGRPATAAAAGNAPVRSNTLLPRSVAAVAVPCRAMLAQALQPLPWAAVDCRRDPRSLVQPEQATGRNHRLPEWTGDGRLLSLAASLHVAAIDAPAAVPGSRMARVSPDWRQAMPPAVAAAPIPRLTPAVAAGIAASAALQTLEPPPIAVGIRRADSGRDWIALAQRPAFPAIAARRRPTAVAGPLRASHGSLHRLMDRLHPLDPPAASHGPLLAQAGPVSHAAPVPCALPAFPPPADRRLPSANSVAVEPPGPEKRTKRPVIASDWRLSPAAPCRPARRDSAAAGGVRTRAGLVPCRLAPNPAAGALAASVSADFCSGFRVRHPRRVSPPAAGHALAASVAVPHPLPQAPKSRALCLAHADLTPEPCPPASRRSASSPAPAQFPIRLYAVPRAMPASRPASGPPLVLPMDLWASPAAIRASGLAYDDGLRRLRPSTAQRFGDAVRRLLPASHRSPLLAKFHQLPSDLKWIALVVPLILGIWVLARPSSNPPVSAASGQDHAASAAAGSSRQTSTQEIEPPPAPVEEPAAAHTPEPVPANPPLPAAAPEESLSRWQILNTRIAARASVDLNEDFRNGLSLWDGRGEWARTWSYDRSGTVRPGQMAVFQPTAGLKNYVFEMKASIERRSIQWLIRAADVRNYHFARLNVTPGTPLTKLELERWTVLNGRAGRVTRLPLPHGGANQTVYSIRVDVNGDSITTYLQDQVIDTFNDSRLAAGGIGLVGSTGDRPRIYGIRVFYQNDFLGKLCSFLSPQPISNQRTE